MISRKNFDLFILTKNEIVIKLGAIVKVGKRAQKTPNWGKKKFEAKTSIFDTLNGTELQILKANVRKIQPSSNKFVLTYIVFMLC